MGLTPYLRNPEEVLIEDKIITHFIGDLKRGADSTVFPQVQSFLFLLDFPHSFVIRLKQKNTETILFARLSGRYCV